MENFKNEVRQLLTRYPQVESVTFTIKETVFNSPTVEPIQPLMAPFNPVNSIGPVEKSTIEKTLEHLQTVGKAQVKL